ncbi:hypothetical protein NM208_g14682 [Fusarium decemcellulare]|uniref:Uncharacterized protein n=1 Tax=Fusarium decemcellulare TaxID=57161 RepID=A0ACC1RGM5_9HYPO|nr:hypothetical protein NM208_g14682 [Fusarium decemcellulare]
MASQKPQDPLDTLQLMVNDVLVQTGKALRASRKDAQGSTQPPQGALKSKLPDTIHTFHSALNELEWDIINSKSVLMRDLKRLQERKQQQSQQLYQSQPTQASQPPQPIEPQSKSPMVIDLESSPPPPGDQPIMETKPNQPVAPFPDMGMGLPDMGQPDVVMQDEPAPHMPPTSVVDVANMKTSASPAPAAATAPMAPMPNMDQKTLDNNTMDLTRDVPHSELNFTNMEFTLAPTNNDSQNPPTTQESSFDLATFAPPDGNDDILGLDNLLPANPTNQANPTPAPPGQSIENQVKTEPLMNPEGQATPQEMKTESFESAFDDDIFGNIDSGGNLGGNGMTDPTFEELMADRDEDFDIMEHGDFDAAFFGIDKV